MKSKRANDYVMREVEYEGLEIVENAIELAEDDARERAAQTFCALQRLDCEIHCTPCIGAECVGRNEFLKHYDNEQ